MPPGHLQVRSAEPRVVGEARFLWWHIVGTVDIGEILREHYPPLQFFGSWVGAVAEINEGGLVPVAVPEFLVGLLEGGEGGIGYG